MTDESQIAPNLGNALNAYGVYTWTWVVALSLAGGIANFFRRLRSGKVRPFNFTEFAGEIFVSGFTGVCTFLLCQAAQFDLMWSSALVAISGHMGSRALFLFERIFTKRFGTDADNPVDSDDTTERPLEAKP